MPTPAVHCQPSELFATSPSISCSRKWRSPSRQSSKRSLDRKLATIIRERLSSPPLRRALAHRRVDSRITTRSPPAREGARPDGGGGRFGPRLHDPERDHTGWSRDGRGLRWRPPRARWPERPPADRPLRSRAGRHDPGADDRAMPARHPRHRAATCRPAALRASFGSRTNSGTTPPERTAARRAR